MKKTLIVMGSLVVILLTVAGCASTSGENTRSRIDREYEKFMTERPATVIVDTGDQSVDSVATATANIYGATIKFLDEYVAATNNHRPYLGFVNEVKARMEDDKNLTGESAIAAVLDEVKKLDAEKPQEEQEYFRIVEGSKAVEALKPANKLIELAQLTIETDKVLGQINGLSKSFKGFDPAIQTKIKSVKNIKEQAEFTSKAIKFLQYRYEQEQNFKNFMQ